MSKFEASLDDMHCHVGFMKDPSGFVHDAQAAQAQVFAVSVTPHEYRNLAHALESQQDDAACFLQRGLGIHPWWVPEESGALVSMLDEFDECFSLVPHIGEIGLDFAKRHIHTKENQVRVFSHILNRCKDRGGVVLSLHCVQAYSELERLCARSGVLENCSVIFHWFSGSSQQLTQAIKDGYYFSVSSRMLTSKRGKEYAKVLPEKRLLLETDAPEVTICGSEIPSVSYTFKQNQDELQKTLCLLADVRGQEQAYLAGVIKNNVQQLFSLK